ncbi:MAG: large conductance mechanosensitive channel protein MscL [Anaerolineaceae bacterium]|nr:large conductance mechanosensitive channel protein MscL [Anaerolineae bacterium]MCB9458724.1 large conductance mechanosensitive channel protein MscL [Anaerolineaceae bacterium]
MLKEFREFLMRGNVLDLAVGIIIGAAFTAIVTSLVDDIISPIIGLITGGVDFSEVVINLNEATTLNVGNFINAIINFVIVGFVLFMIIRAYNQAMARFEEKEEEAPAEPTTEEKLVVAIEKLNTHLEKQS